MRCFETRNLILLIVLLSLFGIVAAQEGPHYAGSREVHEKQYGVSQKHGRNILNLAKICVGYYDEEGNLVDQQIQKGNKTYLGRIRKNISKNPLSVETLEFDHANQLISRKVNLAGDKQGETTFMEYDAKGKILNKISKRMYQDNVWTMEYSQVGYVARYIQSLQDSIATVQGQRVYDYNGEIIENHSYIFDLDDRLLAIVAQSPADSVIFKKEYRYDYQGNLIEEKHFQGEDSLTESFRYSYDDQNRMVQSSEYYWNPRFGVIPQLRKQSEYSYK